GCRHQPHANLIGTALVIIAFHIGPLGSAGVAVPPLDKAVGAKLRIGANRFLVEDGSVRRLSVAARR
ncbi:hypothetical protein, partial [Novosphingobium sp. Chol11]|uniref:hypothetical protein n=1 Tax=Novosphingobium sp. Chol11 TaxID=1385763 RepID=UPI001C3EEDC8